MSDPVLRWSDGAPDALATALEAAPGFEAVFFDGAGTGAHLEVARAHGVRTVVLAIHGASREVHEHHAGPGTYDAALRALAGARGLGLSVRVATAITRSTLHMLEALPNLLRARHAASWILSLPSIREDDRDPRFTRVIPRLGLAAPRALAATERAARVGLPTTVVGLPRCTVGKLGARVAPSSPRAFASVCASCPARVGCVGVDATYLARFGSDELRAVPDEARGERDPIAAQVQFDWRAFDR